ncbi:MAG: hypothetical protein KAJ19_09035, partial [Gammaproteobacteria bacterium]|nr:hypothetical protein [Gammaproteobacteria bacterium]
DSSPRDIIYSFGQSQRTTLHWSSGATANGTGEANGIDALGYMTFDDSCSLICGSVWDSNGFVRDPQAWEGWYKSQPQVFFGASFWKNSGKTAPATLDANEMEISWFSTDDYVFSADAEKQVAASVINAGIGGTTTAVDGDTLPAAPSPDPQTEIMAPFWANTGNWIDLSKLTQTTFADMFGVAIENTDFNKIVAVNKAALVNTSDAGNRIQIQDSADASNAALFVTDSSGNVVDSMIYDGTPNGDSVLVPTGANYYVVTTSDTGNAKIKKWDTSVVSTAGSVTWESVWGFEIGDRASGITTLLIPAEGITIAVPIPVTSDSIVAGFATIEYPSSLAVAGRIEYNISETVGDRTSPPVKSVGTEANSIAAGINVTGHDLELTPGNTYFWNLRFESGIEHVIFLQHAWAE